MPRELPLLDALVPTMFLAFLLAVVLQTLLDRLLGVCGVYRHVWHPPLFRLSVFACIFGGCGLLALHS
jgi:protein AaeX